MTITWAQSLPVWWSFFWRAFLYSMVFGAIAGGLAGFVVGLQGAPEQGGYVGSIAGWIMSIPASMLAFKQAIQKHSASLGSFFGGAEI